jgi:uncharacterized damage-inducible protein DinB
VTERPEPPFDGNERANLIGFLEFQRATLAWKCEGLDAEQLARRSMPPSGMSLLGLIRHMAEVERAWFDRVAGRKRPQPYSTPENWNLDFDGAVADRDVIKRAFLDWYTSMDEARAVVADTELNATFVRADWDKTISLRWVLTHMIEEYARHNGHADLLREAIDGMTGE